MFSGNKMELEIITPDAFAYQGEVNFILVRTLEGDLGILPGHTFLMAALDMWPVKIEVDGEEHLLAVFQGFMEVTPEKVTILTSHCELPEAIDVDRAERARKRAEERIASRSGDIDMARAELALHRALTRLRTTKRISIG